MTPDPLRVQKKVDEEWKNQVEREKIAQSAQTAAPKPENRPAGAGAPPQAEPVRRPSGATFETFLSSLALQAYLALGEEPDPMTGRVEVQLDQAQYMIDILGILEEKTRGNLTDPEWRALSALLYDLRMKFVEKKGP